MGCFYGMGVSGWLQKLSLGAAEEENFLGKPGGLRLNVTGRVEGIVVDFKALNAETHSLVDIDIFGRTRASGYESLGSWIRQSVAPATNRPVRSDVVARRIFLLNRRRSPGFVELGGILVTTNNL